MRLEQGPDTLAQPVHMQKMPQRSRPKPEFQEVWMILMDRFADVINTIKTNERIGRRECTVYSTGLVKATLDLMKKEKYIEDYSEFSERYVKRLRVVLSNRINGIGVVKPRFSISKNDIQKYEERYIPSKDFGILIISTPKGLMTNKEARAANLGGRLIAYVY
ncbi:MAG: ribosomal protein S8 [Candidatus Micrarchaeum acidiphilum ARMAN-2]|uniref:Ribosomal protein S8 n=1 Tax=Candidatus Micrarchaeum acidiphilum ARMAN-2 TaxID=425595 RepID=C7DIU2_MICA2|nr:MAG: ribosomal protein S8 [Candidatus Micrarchaeum acidiphilum ARMAN-2]